MATIYKTDGSFMETKPRNGRDFSLEELKEVVEGYIEIVYLPKGMMMVVNEEGHLLKLEPNLLASQLAGQFIVGNVLVCKRGEIK